MESGDGNTGEWPPASSFSFFVINWIEMQDIYLLIQQVSNPLPKLTFSQHKSEKKLSTFCIIDSLKRRDMAAFQKPC